MSIITPRARRLGRANKPFSPVRARLADFARAAVFAEFGYRHGKAIDCANFLDRRPGQAPMSAPGAWIK